MKEFKIALWIVVAMFAITLLIKGVTMYINIAFLTLPQLHINNVGWKYVFDMLYSLLVGGYVLTSSLKAIAYNWNNLDE